MTAAMKLKDTPGKKSYDQRKEHMIKQRHYFTNKGPPGEGNGNPLQYSCLENPMDRGAWWATVHGVMKSRTQLSDFTFT